MKTVEDLIKEHLTNDSDSFDRFFKEDVITIAHEFSNQFKSWIDGHYKKPSDQLPVMCFDEFTRTQVKGKYWKTFNSWTTEDKHEPLKVRYWHYLLPNPQQ